MPNPPRRARFQFHLSTAIVMMFVAGALMWVNMQRQSNVIGMHMTVYSHYGWPAWAVEEYTRRHSVYEEIPGSDFLTRIGETKTTHYSTVWLGALIDASIALFFLCAIWLFCEWLIRLRTAPESN